MKLTIVGTGYVGLVTGTGFANLGNDVICLDVDEAKIEALRNGVMPIYEPGLEELFRRNAKSGRLQVTTDPVSAIQEAEIIFVCVGTPTDENMIADLSAVDAVAKTIGTHMKNYTIIVNKSTVPVGTADRVRGIIEEHQREAIEFDVVSNPEFLREDAAVKDFENPDHHR